MIHIYSYVYNFDPHAIGFRSVCTDEKESCVQLKMEVKLVATNSSRVQLIFALFAFLWMKVALSNLVLGQELTCVSIGYRIRTKHTYHVRDAV